MQFFSLEQDHFTKYTVISQLQKSHHDTGLRKFGVFDNTEEFKVLCEYSAYRMAAASDCELGSGTGQFLGPEERERQTASVYHQPFECRYSTKRNLKKFVLFIPYSICQHCENMTYTWKIASSPSRHHL